MSAATPLESNRFRFRSTTGAWPDAHGRFGAYGGIYVAETLIAPLEELTAAYTRLRKDPEFVAELDRDLKHYVGRPSPIYHAERLSKKVGGAQILLKREDLNHTGAHKINNTVGQALVAKRMGKRRIIAETGAGQHGVASATVAARLGLECVVYMGAVDIERQAINVFRMKLLGAKVVPVTSGSKTLKDALNEAMRDWVTNVDNTFYIIGTVAGPHPYPMMVRDFNAIVGREARQQMLDEYKKLPDALVACVGGGSNAIGLFHAFLNDRSVAIFGAEAAGDGIDDRQTRGIARGGSSRRAARQSHVCSVRRQRPDHRNAFDFRGSGLSRRRPRARVAEGHAIARSMPASPMPKRCRRSTNSRARKAFSRRSNPVMPLRWP